MSSSHLLLFAGGLALLLLGAEALVRGAAALARLAGLSPLVVGLTVVALGTSAPEMAVSLTGALGGQEDLALGNVVGSNIVNILLILGLSALITPLSVAQKLVRVDVPLMIGISVLSLLLGLDGRISRSEGALLLGGLVLYLLLCFVSSRIESPRVAREYEEHFGGRGRPRATTHLVLVVGGLALLVLGSRWLVEAAAEIGRDLGLSELVIGLTVVALGTSLPEVATSAVAAFHGERDIAVGNVVGSNIINLLAVLGGAAALAPGGVEIPPSALSLDLPVMVTSAVICLPVCFTGYRIARGEGLIFLLCFGLYLAFQVLEATRHDALPTFSWIVSSCALPLTALTLAILTGKSLGRLRPSQEAARAGPLPRTGAPSNEDPGPGGGEPGAGSPGGRTPTSAASLPGSPERE